MSPEKIIVFKDPDGQCYVAGDENGFSFITEERAEIYAEAAKKDMPAGYDILVCTLAPFSELQDQIQLIREGYDRAFCPDDEPEADYEKASHGN